jgi:hypothetical protein
MKFTALYVINTEFFYPLNWGYENENVWHHTPFMLFAVVTSHGNRDVNIKQTTLCNTQHNSA